MGGRGSGGGRSGGGGGGTAKNTTGEGITDKNELINLYNSTSGNSNLTVEQRVKAMHDIKEKIDKIDKSNSLRNQSNKYDDEAYKYKTNAKGNMAMALDYKKKGKLKSAEKYEKYAAEDLKKAKQAERKSKKLAKEANKLAPQKSKNIPRSYSYKGETGTRTVYKSQQAALEQWKQRKANTVSTALADQPTIVHSPKGGYSVVPHKIATINKLKEISPYRIQND